MKLTADLIYKFANSCLSQRYDEPKPTPEFHKTLWEYCCDPNPYVAIAAPRGSAKAQPLTSKVLTPSGWSTMGELNIGDEIIGGDGLVSRVIHLHPIYDMDVYKVETRDGKSALCNIEHLWNVEIASNQPRTQVKSLGDILKNWKTQRIDGRSGKHFIEYRYRIPATKPIDFRGKEYLIDPYTLGAWLGDGHSAGGRFTTDDPEILDYFPYKTEKQSAKYGYVIRGIYPKLKEYGLLNNKHIPEEYLFGSIDQRLSLLRGLMDTDGTIGRNQRGRIAYFCNTNKSLIDSTAGLIRSLGGVANIIVNYTTCNNKRFLSWKVSCKLPKALNPFRLKRKSELWVGNDRLYSYIVDIRKHGTVLGRCISVERDTYITDDYLLTHNSTAVTHAYVLAEALFRKSDHIVIISVGDKEAIGFLNDIRMELQENEQIQKLFTIKLPFDKDTEREIEVSCGDDRHRFRIVAKGASGGTGKIRGMKWRGKRPNLIIMDDAEDDEAVMNEDRRAKFREWFYNALLPALSDSGKIRAVGTILHFDSLLESFMPANSGDKAKYTVKSEDGLSEWSTCPNNIWKSIKFRAHPDFDDFSKLLWPEKLSEKMLRIKRQGYLEQGNMHGYSQEYLNYPISEQSSYFRRSDFIPMTDEDKKKDTERRLVYYVASDFAISTKEKRAYTVFIVAGVDEAGMLHIVHVVRGRLDSKQILEEMWAVQGRYNPDVFVVEKGALEKALGPFFYDEMLRTGVSINFHLMSPTEDKVSRSRSIQGRMRQGGVKFNKEAEWFPALEEELIRFDRGPYKDQVDCMAYIGLLLNQLASAPTKEQIEEEEYEEEINKDTSLQGRSKVTGY